MSSRDIEGENVVLYLPQAKIYQRPARLAPLITVSVDETERARLGLSSYPFSAEARAFLRGETSVSQIRRTFPASLNFSPQPGLPQGSRFY